MREDMLVCGRLLCFKRRLADDDAQQELEMLRMEIYRRSDFGRPQLRDVIALPRSVDDFSNLNRVFKRLVSQELASALV